MEHIDHFALAGWAPVVGFVTSFVGSQVGLAAAARARTASSVTAQLAWVGLAAIAIGGVSVWMLHFIAMMGFATDAGPVRFDLAFTAVSALFAVGSVAVGVAVLGLGRFRLWRLLLAGTLTGAGVATMHYTGMYAIRLPGVVTYDVTMVIVSMVIAWVAATIALWCTVVARSSWTITAAAGVMGLGVLAMHYIGMFAMRFQPDPLIAALGIEPILFVAPSFIIVLVLCGVALWFLATPTREEEPAYLS